MKILILGGAGFIGSHLTDYHLFQNDTVIAVDNLNTGKLSNIHGHLDNPNFLFYQKNILDWDELGAVAAQSDIIYDLAAMVGMFNVIEHPIHTLQVNVNITQKLLEIIAQLSKKPKVVIASSSEVYGSKTSAMKEEDALITAATNRAHSSYPISKMCNEIAGIAYYKEKQLPVLIVRIFNTVGPRQSSRYGMVLPRFIKQALNHEPLTIFSDGLQTRCFCDVRDLCHILHQLTQTEKSVGEIVNVGNDKPISILDLAKLVIKITDSQSKMVFQTYEEVYGHDDYIDIEHRRPDLKKLQGMIDYHHQWTLEDTIQDIIRFL